MGLGPFQMYGFQPEDQCWLLLLYFKVATVGDQLQVTYPMSDSKITNSIAKTNNNADNSSENNSDSKEIKELLVSINEAYDSVQTL
ncbi:hypothetical protein T4C_4323 [Trichinella pseudospiralis]|uniref:Uncharacterized protein n=1 Tax=Trichinella pseudospiralis TaxID=6337 RepID=A0A0V1KAU6_TRIPS|nr:hypothetical protein T4C_4323 [Trichinella pseudospiralis]